MGYFAYDLARRIEKLPTNAMPAIGTPEMMVGIYDWAVIVDHRAQRSYLVSHGLNAATHENWPRLQALFDAPCKASSYDEKRHPFTVTSPIKSNLTEPQYKLAFNKIKTYLEAGDCYQVNLAQRFSARVSGDSWQAYKKLREISPAPFMAYMNLPLSENASLQVLSKIGRASCRERVCLAV